MNAITQAAIQEMAATGARDVPIPLPVRGLSDKARRSEISGVLANILHNWRSNGVSLELRDGYETVSTDANGAVQRIPFEYGATSERLAVHAGGVTASGTLASIARTMATPVTFAALSSQVLIADGAAPIILYDGATFSTPAFTCSDATDPDTLSGIFTHQDRIFAWDPNRLAFWYGGLGAVTGELTLFPLDRLGNLTGKLALITAMTVDAGHGMNDVLVIVTSTGQVVLYEGLDPGDPLDWRQTGRYKAAPPVNRFSAAQIGADVWLLTVRGVVSLKDVLMLNEKALQTPLASPVAGDIKNAARLYGSLDGWQIIERPEAAEVIVNTPTGANTFKQFIYVLDEQAWFSADYPAQNWHESDGVTEFSGLAGVLRALAPEEDDDGTAITAIWETAWLRVGGMAEVAYLIPTIVADATSLEVTLVVLTDHDETADDIVQGSQTFVILPDNAGDGVALDEMVGCGAMGRTFRLKFTATGRNMSFESLIAGVS